MNIDSGTLGLCAIVYLSVAAIIGYLLWHQSRRFTYSVTMSLLWIVTLPLAYAYVYSKRVTVWRR